MSDNLTPLEVCEALFGGFSNLEAAVGAKPKGAYAWARASRFRQAGDLPPHVQRKALTKLRIMKLDIQEKWLIEGATRDDIDAAVQAARRLRAAQASEQVAAE